MPPKRVKHNTSTSSTDAIPPLPPSYSKPPDETLTPPQNKSAGIGITQAQKQALIDNLQLEITERARKLRAQYALQAQGLRSRLEMRVNRIPQALRKRKMQDLLDEQAERMNPKPAPDSLPVVEEKNAEEQRKSLKRTSDQISTSELEDREDAAPAHDLANPKKRTKTTTTTAPAAQANTKVARTASRKGAPAAVLSPKSHNSRTLPRSPFKAPASPEKPSAQFQRPLSPVKPHIASQQQKRTASRQTKKTAAPAEIEGRSSEASNTSAGTTIVSKAGAAKVRPAAGKKPAAAAKTTTTVTAAAKKAAASAVKKENVPPAASGRSLRKRA